MKYRERIIPKTVSELKAWIDTAILRVPRRHFPDSFGYDFEGIFYTIERGVENLRPRFGDAKTNQLLDMLAQAKAHYEAGENRLGGALMQDTEMTVMDRQPWAYPKERYRWPIDPTLPEPSESDLLNKDDDGD
jgi:hypothetical protein